MTYLLMLILILVALYIYIIILYIRYVRRRTNELAEKLTTIALMLETILNTLLEYEEKSNYWGE